MRTKVTIASNGKRKSVTKRTSVHHRTGNTEDRLEKMLEVRAIIDNELKGYPLPKVENKTVVVTANKIINLSKNNRTKEQADKMITNLNHKIVIANKRDCDPKKSKILYDKLLKSN